MTSKFPEGSSTAAAVTNAGASASGSSVFGGTAGSVETAGAVAGGAGGADGVVHRYEMPQVDRLFSDRVVTILVGPHEVKWCLHENLLSGVSDFFKSAFNSGFKESIEGQITMPEDDPQAFELFVRWLYMRTLVPQAVTSPTTTANLLFRHAGGAAACINDSLHLYVLASKLLIEDLENACVDIAHAYYGVGMRRPDIKDVQYIYDNTVPGSGMRKLLRERLTLGLFKGRQHNPVTAEWRDIMNETPDLGFDIINEVAAYNWIAGGNAPARAIADKCAYHRHDRSEASTYYYIAKMGLSEGSGAARDHAKVDKVPFSLGDLLSHRIVTIYVGPPQKSSQYTVHENLLSSNSEFFRASFSGGFRESTDGVLKPSEDEPRIFELFVAWIYSQPLHFLNASRPKVLPPPDGKHITIRDYLHLYVFASKYLMEDLQDEVMDIAYDYYAVPGHSPNALDVEFIYQNTTTESMMRPLLRAYYLFELFSGETAGHTRWGDVLIRNGEIGHELIAELATWKLKMGERMDMAIKSRCSFHVCKKKKGCHN
ncbi:hypothetical protein VMCG_07433 [Cytospora schulzeri]|uniref:BTB domain-containing protein n=1 Tax=Cytospora schulzeri TaxID=448051 RepID=A0A423W324_9PEZI|nr:hypothetical protein VMCG_07433 [Valsa malicola]